MKKGIKTAFFVVFLVVPLLVLAQVRHPGLLPTNPFYFAKEGLRNLRRALTFDQTAKAELELRFLEERAAEIKKIIELRGRDEETLALAISAYQADLETLNQYLKNSSDKLIPKLISWSFRHSQLFSDLGLEELRQPVARFLLFYFERPLVAAVVTQQSGEFKELRAAELLQIAASRLDAARLTDDLLIGFVARVKSGEITLEELLLQPGDLLLRLQTLDEARLRIDELELKSKLNLWRQKLLERAGEEGLVTAGIIKALIDNLERGPLTNQVKYLLTQGQELFSEGNNLAAFGYLTSAQAAARDEALRAALVKEGWEEEIALLKASYDEVVKQEGGRLSPTLTALANRIVALSDLARAKPGSPDLLKSIREVKLMLNVLRASS